VTHSIDKLRDAGQSVWLDYIRRGLITSGELERMVRDGWITGMTSNPTILLKAISGSTDYDEAIRQIAAQRVTSAYEAFLQLGGDDIRLAADALRPMWRPGILLPPVPPAPAKIIDVSRHQGVIHWAKVKAASVETAIIRATMGAFGIDSEYHRNWQGSWVGGIPHRGAYHLVIMGISAADQIANIMQTTGGDWGNEPLTLDCERTAADRLLLVFPKAQYTALVREMLDRLAVHGRVRIYTSANEWQAMTTLPAWAEGVVDWFAEYNDNITAPPALPPGVTTWKRRQFSHTGSVDGIIGDVDLNIDNVAPAPPPTGALTMAEKQEIEKHLDAVWIILWPKVKAKNPCALYDAPGGAVLKTITDGRNMDVFSKAGPWLLVTQAPNPIYWVRQQDVIQL